MNRVEFMSYTSDVKALCQGTLKLRIDGRDYVFGHGAGMYPVFWRSGGYCRVNFGGADDEIVKKPWEVCKCMLPEEIQPLALEIGEAFNANVPFGCCGGCVG